MDCCVVVVNKLGPKAMRELNTAFLSLPNLRHLALRGQTPDSQSSYLHVLVRVGVGPGFELVTMAMMMVL